MNFCRTQRLQNSTTTCYLSQTKMKSIKVMLMMQYMNCVVKAHKVQTVKLTLYKYKS